jgi:5'-3' exoribonuclease 2
MMLEIFKYTERVVNMVRPRKLLFIAIDGVAPRAKMNQQRSRRFRSAQDASIKEAATERIIEELKAQGKQVDESLKPKRDWDSNAITPGTPFMDILAISLRYWIVYKLNTDPGWGGMSVILSDAAVPGEGEHKIMEFIRSQRASPAHDPNTKHVMYGLDADLIMLGLATHEAHFTVLREDVFFQESNNKGCRICGQEGHFAAECTGIASLSAELTLGKPKEKSGEFDEKGKARPQKPFIWLHVNILREYLEAEMFVPGMSFQFDLERAIDDWVFMCFFVGNDFLPHLPSLDIRENAIDTLISIWKNCMGKMGGYVTCDGTVNLARAQIILEALGEKEDAIFNRRHQRIPTPLFADANFKRTKDKRTEMPKGNEEKLLRKIKFQKTYLPHLPLNKSNHQLPHPHPNAADLPSSKPQSLISWLHPQSKVTSISSLAHKAPPEKQSPKQTEIS